MTILRRLRPCRVLQSERRCRYLCLPRVQLSGFNHKGSGLESNSLRALVVRCTKHCEDFLLFAILGALTVAEGLEKHGLERATCYNRQDKPQ